MAEYEPVVITAAGVGSRMALHMTHEMGYPPGYPKHLLPTGVEGETLLGRIVDQSAAAPLHHPPIVGVNHVNEPFIRDALRDHEVVFDCDPYVFSMDRIYYRLMRVSAVTGALTLGCAGDFYTEATWSDVVKAHEASGADMSLLVQRSSTEVRAAVFDVDEQTQRITGLARPPVSPVGSFTNVGMYVISPTDAILDIMHTALPEDPRDCVDDDTIFRRIVAEGLAAAVELPGKYSINVNTPDEYTDLLGYTGGQTATSSRSSDETAMQQVEQQLAASLRTTQLQARRDLGLGYQESVL